MSFAMYRRLKAVVDSWRREEQGKAKVAAAALYGLLAWLVLFAAAAFFVPAYAIPVSVVVFLAWIAFVAAMLRKHIGFSEKP